MFELQNLISNATTPTVSRILDNKLFNALTIEVYGTATSKTFIFEGRNSDKGDWLPCGFTINMNDRSTNATCTKNGVYMVNTSGMAQFRMRLTEVSGGDFTATVEYLDRIG